MHEPRVCERGRITNASLAKMAQTPHELGICPVEFGIKNAKDRGHNALINENGF